MTSGFQPVKAGVEEQQTRQQEIGRSVAATVAERGPRDFEVYYHVPFCLKRCGYCDFNTYTAADLGGGASRGNSANLAIQEAGALHEWQVASGVPTRPASTVFFGGGTPTILPATDLARMLTTVRDLWGIEEGAEVTTEANPDTVDDAYIATLAAAGFTRISFGMQSAVPEVLKTLDRTHTQANVVAGVAAAARYGLRSSVDLIYGAPGETMDQWRTSLDAVLNLGVNHLSAYALSLEPTTKMGRQVARGEIASPDDDDEAAKYEMAESVLAEAGFDWYEISNWARNGEVSRHNMGYWRNVDWAGIGPGAHGHFGRLRAWDTRHPKLWAGQLDSGLLPWQGSEMVTPEEDTEETVMLGLRMHEGLRVDSLEAQTGKHLDSGVVTDLMSEGLLENDSVTLVPTLHGRLLNDLVIERVLDGLA